MKHLCFLANELQNVLIHKALIRMDSGILAESLWECLSVMLIENETRI